MVAAKSDVRTRTEVYSLGNNILIMHTAISLTFIGLTTLQHHSGIYTRRVMTVTLIRFYSLNLIMIQ